MPTKGRGAMSVTEFKVQGRPGRLVTLSEGDYLNVEAHDGYCALAWASDLPLRAALERVEPLLPAHQQPTAIVFDRKSGSRSERVVKNVSTLIKNDLGSISFLRLAFDRLSVTWEDSNGLSKGDEASPHGQVGLIAHVYDRQLIGNLLSRTGTETVAEHAKDLLDQTDYLLSYMKAV